MVNFRSHSRCAVFLCAGGVVVLEERRLWVGSGEQRWVRGIVRLWKGRVVDLEAILSALLKVDFELRWDSVSWRSFLCQRWKNIRR